eukprot:TRINITY_DN27822_c0_g1_i1.p1 TRINITY_DN27822_c0_g1~~TRINITY_DN27822_c0_g1_i1.p1  ORF type:complete len:316 (+),score=71.30 TRINITY_DN27822_c0_g1_i1:73-1020(+)
MSGKSAQTKDLINNLCAGLDKDAYAGTLVKKIVGENMLTHVEDLRQVPTGRLEHWGLPLKLIDEINDWLDENQAESNLSDVSAYINYNVRPVMAMVANPVINTLQEVSEKQRYPQSWAARRIQRNFRARQARKLRKPLVTDEQVMSWVEEGEFFKPSEKQSQELREKRAKEIIRGGVKMWKERKERERAAGKKISTKKELPKDQFLASLIKSNPGSIPALLASRAGPEPIRCPVTEMFEDLGPEVTLTAEDLRPVMHRLVTINWIEEVEDLSLVEDRHWEAWNVPEKVAQLVKEKASEKAPGLRLGRRDCGCVVH